MERIVSSTPDATDRTYGIPPPEFRLPDATHLGGVSLLVSDLPRSVEYYETVIGLHVQSEGAEGVTLGARGGDRPLVRLETREGVQPGRRGAFGLFHFAILLPERSALGRFAAHLSHLGVRAGMADHLVSEALYLADPDGLGIEVYADRRRSAWRRKGRELAMTPRLATAAATSAVAGTTSSHSSRPAWSEERAGPGDHVLVPR